MIKKTVSTLKAHSQVR